MNTYKLSFEKVLTIMLIFVFFSNSTIFGKFNRYILLFFGVLFIIGLISNKIRVHKKLNISHKLLGVILCFLIFNVFMSETILKSMYFWCTFFSTVAIIFINWNTSSMLFLIRWIERLVFVFCITIYLNWFIPNLMTKYLSFLVISDGSKRVLYSEILAGQYSGILSERSCAAVAAALGIGLSFTKFILNKSGTIKHILEIMFFLLALVLTGKRSPILISLIAIVCIMVVVKYPNKGIKLPMVFLGGTLAIYLVLLYFPPVQAIFKRTEVLLENGMALNGRDVLWDIAMDMYYKRPLIGTGINSFNTKFNEFGIWGKDWGSHAHNIYIQLLGETGLIGCLLFCILFILNLSMTIKIIQRKELYNHMDLNTIVIFSFFIQIFWLGYGLSGNTFYYLEQRTMYFVAIVMTIYVQKELDFRLSNNK